MEKLPEPVARDILVNKLDYLIERFRPHTSRGSLTPEMEEHYHRIASYEDYVSLGKQMEQEIETHALCTWDIEETLHLSDPWLKKEGMLIGTLGGVYDLDVMALKREARCEFNGSQDWREILPISLVRLLENSNIAKLGSAIATDAFGELKFGLHVKGLYCTQELARLAAENHSPSREEYATGDRTGFSRISTDVWGFSYKPNERQFPVPRAWRCTHNLYNWTKPLTPFARLYRFLDGVIPLVYLAWLLKRGLAMEDLPTHLCKLPMSLLLRTLATPAEVECSHRRNKKNELRPVSIRVGQGELFDAVAALPNPSAREPEEDEVEHRVEDERQVKVRHQDEDKHQVEVESQVLVEYESEDEDESRGNEAEKTLEVKHGHTTLKLRLERESPPNHYAVTDDDIEQTKRAILRELAGRAAQIPNDGKKRGRTIPGTCFRHNKAKRENNYKRLQPLILRHCSFCGLSSHSKRANNGTILCPTYRVQMRAIVLHEKAPYACDYVHCSNPLSHLTKVCPDLAGRCTNCRQRGHDKSRCPGHVEAALSSMRDEFEKLADNHVLLADRRKNPEWGFHDFLLENKGKLQYAKLLKMPVLKALEKALRKAY